MDRLTTKSVLGGWTLRVPRQEAVNRLAAYENAMPLERAQELARDEKDGRLAVLPEKVGTKKYEILRNASGWYNLVEDRFEKPCVYPTRYILASFKTKEEAEMERERRMSNGTAD